MKKVFPFALTVFCFILALWISVSFAQKEDKGKFAIILQAGTESHEGRARALHSLLYAKELKEHGNEVALIFDGAGTEWIEDFTNPESKSGFASMYKSLKDTAVTEVICDFCSTAFKVHKNLEDRKIPMEAGYFGHPSIAKWTDKGYQLVIL